MPDYIFLSYDRADHSYVDFVVRRLVAERIPYWIDHERDTDDQSAALSAEKLAGAAAVVVVVTPAAMASRRVERELHLAHELGKPVLSLVRSRVAESLFDATRAEFVTGGGMPSAAFYDRLRRHTGSPVPERIPGSWRPRTRLPHRLGPIPRTPAEAWGVRALLAAAVILAVAGVFGRDWRLFLIFPAFGIPDLLFAWFRWRRFRICGRWSGDVRALVLLSGLTLYLTVAAAARSSGVTNPFLLIGVPAALLLSYAATVVWVIQVIRDRPSARAHPGSGAGHPN